MLSNKILEVKNLEKSFLDPNNNPFKVLNDISLSLDSGEILGLVGESGSGKTTLGRIIIRLLNSDSGQILFDGQDHFAKKNDAKSSKKYANNFSRSFWFPKPKTYY